ncbi:MAG: hypothetical protein HYS19_02815 [Nitrosomonadales bacterium]|nr:hypothetical protein [Nitrosomonadales bacterium]
MKKRFTEEQIIGFLKQAEVGIPVKELCCGDSALGMIDRLQYPVNLRG